MVFATLSLVGVGLCVDVVAVHAHELLDIGDQPGLVVSGVEDVGHSDLAVAVAVEAVDAVEEPPVDVVHHRVHQVVHDHADDAQCVDPPRPFALLRVRNRRRRASCCDEVHRVLVHVSSGQARNAELVVRGVDDVSTVAQLREHEEPWVDHATVFHVAVRENSEQV